MTWARRPRKAHFEEVRGETNEATDIDTLVATTFFISREATTGARASAHPGAARDAPDRTELQTSSESVGHEIKSSVAVIVGKTSVALSFERTRAQLWDIIS